MSPDRLLDRVRAANPAQTITITDSELFARIITGPGDPRLDARPRRRRRIGARGLALLAGAVVLCGAGGTVGAVQLLSHASPKALFEADPQGQYSRRPGRIWGGTGQTVIPSTVHRATSFTVPGVGRFQYWIALSRPKGWLCSAIRQPDGTWAALTDDKYQLGGPVPGCGTLPWHDSHGFSYYPSSIQHRGTTWRIVYGYVPTTGHPVTVRDNVHHVTARIGDGRYFAIVIPLCKGRAQCSLPVPRPGSGFQLQTLDASGRVLVTDAYDPGA
jgi:hypothetical protein